MKIHYLINADAGTMSCTACYKNVPGEFTRCYINPAMWICLIKIKIYFPLLAIIKEKQNALAIQLGLLLLRCKVLPWHNGFIIAVIPSWFALGD